MTHYRHREQLGHVAFHGRKIPIQKPPMREQEGREVALEIPNPKGDLLDQARGAMRVLHWSANSERSYADWIRRYARFHGSKCDEDPANRGNQRTEDEGPITSHGRQR